MDSGRTWKYDHGAASGDAITGAQATLTGLVCTPSLLDSVAASGYKDGNYPTHGIKMVTQVYQQIERATFLSRVFMPALRQNETVLLPTPRLGRIVSRTFWSEVALSPRKLRRWVKATCKGLWVDVAHCPILNDLVSNLLNQLEDARDLPIRDDDYRVKTANEHQEHPRAEEFLSHRYCLSLREVGELRAEARAFVLGGTFSLPAWAQICAIDLA